MKEKKTREVPTAVRAEIDAAMRRAANTGYGLNDKMDMTRLKTYQRLFDEFAEKERGVQERFTDGKGLTAEERMAYMEALQPFKLSMELLRRLISIETVRLHACVFGRIWQVFEDGSEPDADKIMAVLDDILRADKLNDEKVNNPDKNIYAAAWGM